jgi:hypothetical protein
MTDNVDKRSNVRVLKGTFARGLGEPEPPPVDGDDLQPDATDMADDRLSRLEGAYDALKVVRPMLMTVVAILLAAAIGSFAFLGSQVASISSRIDSIGNRIDRLGDKLDAIPSRLNEELRAMRAEMTAQTSALANAITAAKQEPPQVIVVPAPQTPPAPTQQTPNRKQ